MKRGATLAAVLTSGAWLAAGAAPLPDPGVLPGGSAPGFAQALSPRAFAFPRDHGPHPEFRHEWWYVTGNLDATGGARFGFELTFFRFALAPPAPAGAAGASTAAPGLASRASSAWRTREIYLAHFAITDVAAGRFRYATKVSRAALGLGGAEGPPLHAWIDDWTLGAADGADWTLAAAQEGYALELELHPLAPPVPNGAAGLSRKSDAPGSASYYYSIPRIAVQGRLVRAGRPLDVHGLAWLDREWGSGGLGPHEVGWDWFALQLEDGSALMFYALRRSDGSRDPHSAGTWVESAGAARPLASAAVEIDVTDHWSSADGVRYPAGWRVRVPTLALDVSVHPALADQELRTTPRYFEGAVDVSGARGGRPLRGRGYVELVGYAGGR